MNEQRRVTDPLVKTITDIKTSVDRIDNTIHGNGKMGLKTRVYLLWYAAWGAIVMLGILAGCYFKG